ncbi:MAG: hypothetical protein HQL82_11155 [Magnetococcales bacterium]|nr:hypothetical protein [Magnetococcales bacterium]
MDKPYFPWMADLEHVVLIAGAQEHLISLPKECRIGLTAAAAGISKYFKRYGTLPSLPLKLFRIYDDDSSPFGDIYLLRSHCCITDKDVLALIGKDIRNSRLVFLTCGVTDNTERWQSENIVKVSESFRQYLGQFTKQA